MANINELTPFINSQIVGAVIKANPSATKKQFYSAFKSEVESRGYNYKDYNAYCKKYFSQY